MLKREGLRQYTMKSLLNNPQVERGDRASRVLIRETFRNLHFRHGLTFASASKLMAKRCFEANDYDEGIYHVIQVHGIVPHQRIINTYYCTKRRDGKIEKKYVEGKSLYNRDYNSILAKLEEMPKEWTVVQLTCAVDANWRYKRVSRKDWNPVLHVLRMECGPQSEYQPLHLYLQPPSGLIKYSAFDEMDAAIRKNNTDQLVYDRQLFWDSRRAVDVSLQNIITYMNEKWFTPVAPFLSGHLVDDNLRRSIRTNVEKIFKVIKRDSGWPESAYCLIHKAAEHVHLLDSYKLLRIFVKALEVDCTSKYIKILLEKFEILREKFAIQLAEASRHPVILIVENDLDNFPFESLVTLYRHPVSRIASLSILHGLYTIHKDSMKNGMKIVSRDSGFFLINPGGNLKDMEKRMKDSVLPVIPNLWNGVIARPLDVSDNENMLLSDIFVFMGHGNGSRHWKPTSYVNGIPFVSLLFGCRSAGMKRAKGTVETDGSLQFFQTTGCPCLVGMLWSVTDKDTDLVADGLLRAWLPTIKPKKKGLGASNRQKYVTEKLASIEPELLRSVAIGRDSAMMSWTHYSLVARGLPVLIE